MKPNSAGFPIASSFYAPRRGVAKNQTTRRMRVPNPVTSSQKPIDPCYRALLETSSSAILHLSPTFIILEWSRAAETLSGWTADEAVGRSFVELCLQTEARESFLAELIRAAAGDELRGVLSPLRDRTGSQTMLSWNISPVAGVRGYPGGVMAVGTVVISPVRMEEDLQSAETKIESEGLRSQRTIEEERRKIARELHDEFGQALTGLKFDLAWVASKLERGSPPVGITDFLTKIRAMSDTVDALMESVHATATSLRPAMLDDLGLIPALECLLKTFQHRTRAHCVIDADPELSSIEVASDASAALFRIAQELLTNVTRHALASRVHIRLFANDGRVTLEVTDNGKGIAPDQMTNAHSLGLRGIKERASLLGGHFHIVGTPGVGTTACASVPVANCFTR